jgi:hypothetical protein
MAVYDRLNYLTIQFSAGRIDLLAPAHSGPFALIPRSFTFYVAHPVRSIQTLLTSSFLLLTFVAHATNIYPITGADAGWDAALATE